jgi:hypothetical protein
MRKAAEEETMVINAATTQVLSREQIVNALENESQRRLQMSAEKLVEHYRDGTLDQLGDVADLLALAAMLEPSDPLSVKL